MIRKRISDPRSLGSWSIKGAGESLLRVDSPAPLMRHDPSDLGSLILFQIISKERTLSILTLINDPKYLQLTMSLETIFLENLKAERSSVMLNILAISKGTTRFLLAEIELGLKFPSLRL